MKTFSLHLLEKVYTELGNRGNRKVWLLDGKGLTAGPMEEMCNKKFVWIFLRADLPFARQMEC